MKRKSHHIEYLMSLLLILITLSNFDFSRNISNTFILDDEFEDTVTQNEDLDDPTNIESQEGGGVIDPGYHSPIIDEFDVYQNASSIIKQRDFNAIDTNSFTISTPDNMSAHSETLSLEAYNKENILRNSAFSSYQYWSHLEQTTGYGTISQSWVTFLGFPNSVKTILSYSGSADGTAFNSGDYGTWGQSRTDLNPSSYELANGKKYQNKSQDSVKYEHFISDTPFEPHEGIEGELNTCPYGGVLSDKDREYVDVRDGNLRIEIDPWQGEFHGNPSACWWYYINIPYAPDYAQLKLTWSVDSLSDYQSTGNYSVRARINDQYIDGTKLINRTDSIPLFGSAEELIKYTNPTYLEHGFITRTYNITGLINGLTGRNKFDFGVWAKNPITGLANKIIVKFKTIEISYNTSDKYEVAKLKFRYKCVDDYYDEGEILSDPYKITNKASIGIKIVASGNQQLIFRALPFSQMVINTSSQTPVWHYVEFSIPSIYANILKLQQLSFFFGVFYEKTSKDLTQMAIQYDDVELILNYKYPNLAASGLQYRVDGGSWLACSDQIPISTAGWINGQNHNFKFRSSDGKTTKYINVKSELWLKNVSLAPHGAFARYHVNSLNNGFGIWDIEFNNTYYVNPLKQLNSTSNHLFNLSSYNIAFLQLPAFDGKGKHSEDWNVISAISPSFINYSSRIVRFNSINENNQSARITQAYETGNWTLRAIQLNYIVDYEFNASDYYILDIPIFYRGKKLGYNYTLYEAVNGMYNLTMFNQDGQFVAGFPQYLTNDATNKYINNSIDIDEEQYNAGEYFIGMKWNDTGQAAGKTRRFGSNVNRIFIYNATTAEIVRRNKTVDTGHVANITLKYTTNYTGYNGINTTNLFVYENSTGVWRLWGKTWGTQYKASFLYWKEGRYNLSLQTAGVPTGKYHLRFIIWKNFNQLWDLNASLEITSVQDLIVNVSEGAYWDDDLQRFILLEGNYPFVNDTVNSHLIINVSSSLTGQDIEVDTVQARIGENGTFFYASYISSGPYTGLYNLTINTTGLNATYGNSNKTLYIFATKSGFSPGINNVTIYINPIPTSLTLDPITDTYEGGVISVVVEAYKLIDPNNPVFYNNGNLTFYIYNRSTYKDSEEKLTGTLDFFKNGLYIKDISLSGLSSGCYNLYINTTKFNFAKNKSNIIQFDIKSKYLSKIEIIVPETVRILSQFQIEAELSYKANNTKIADQTLEFNITIIKIGGIQESYIVLRTTDSSGSCYYDYIIPSDYEDGTLIVNITYSGQETIASCENGTSRIIKGLIPIELEIISYPIPIRVGYSATYSANITILDESEDVENRIILFTAYYDAQILNPFVSQQIYTDSKGKCTYTITEIDDGHSSITVFFEYLGSTTVAYNSTSRTDSITPKWTSNITLGQIPSIIRFGQPITLNLTFSCQNGSISLQGQSIEFSIRYGGKMEVYSAYISANKKILFNYTIPDTFNAELGFNISIVYSGTTKIAGDTMFRAFSIQQKLGIVISWVQEPLFNSMEDEYYFSVIVTDTGGNLMRNFEVIFQVLDDDSVVISELAATTNQEGIASASLSIEDVGVRFTIQATFGGYQYYAASSLVFTQELITITINFLDALLSQYKIGAYYFFVNVTNNNGEALQNIDLIWEVLDENGKILYQTTSTTNQEGISSAELSFTEIGNEITIKVSFSEKSVFASSLLESSAIRVVNEFVLFLDVLPYILIAAGIVAASVFTVYKTVLIPRRNRKREELARLYQKMSDVENIQYLLLIIKEAGTPIYSKSLADVPIDESLVSGFLTAISSFGEEIGSKMKDIEKEGGLEDLAYRQFKITIKEGKYIKTALLLLKRPSSVLKQKLIKFNEVIEEKFEEFLSHHRGEVLQDMEVDPIVEQVLEADLLYPHHLIQNRANQYVKELSKRNISKQIIDVAISTEFDSNFYLRDMINHLKTKGIEEIKTFESLEQLKADKVVFALNPRTNYLIEQLNPFFKQLTEDDRHVLFAIFDGNLDVVNIRKHIKKQGVMKEIDIEASLEKMKTLDVLEKSNQVNNTGIAIATLLKLIPDL